MSVVDTLQEVYGRLLARFGPQHWWPGDSGWEMMVGAVLTQAVSWSNVERAIANLKSSGVLSPPPRYAACPRRSWPGLSGPQGTTM